MKIMIRLIRYFEEGGEGGSKDGGLGSPQLSPSED